MRAQLSSVSKAIQTFLAVSCACVASVFAIEVHGQSAQRLQTGSGEALQTVSVNVSVPPPDLSSVLSFDVAFATSEIPAPGVFLDALSLTLQRGDQAQSAVLLTLDAFGLKLAPPSAGAFQLNADAVKAASIAYFGSLSDPAARSAYHVSLDLPGQFAGAGQLLMDLFDNGDALTSVALLANLSIVSAPEPGPIALAALGGLLLAALRRSK